MAGCRAPHHVAYAVHYVGRHKEDDSVFVDTRKEKAGEPVSVVAGRGAHAGCCMRVLVFLDVQVLQYDAGCLW